VPIEQCPYIGKRYIRHDRTARLCDSIEQAHNVGASNFVNLHAAERAGKYQALENGLALVCGAQLGRREVYSRDGVDGILGRGLFLAPVK